MRAKTAVERDERTAGPNGRRGQGVRHSAAQWARLIETQRHSALTVVEFCRRRRIAKATFWYWRRRLALAATAPGMPAPQRFLEVPIVSPVAQPVEVGVGALRVRLEGLAAARVVDAIVAAVGAVRGASDDVRRIGARLRVCRAGRHA